MDLTAPPTVPRPGSAARVGALFTYVYAGLLLALFLAILSFVPPREWANLVRRDELLRAVGLTFASSFLSTLIALAVAIPIAWRLSHRALPGQTVIEVLIDLPMSLSPLVTGLGFLLFFATAPGRAIERQLIAIGFPLRGEFAGVVVAQAIIATAFSIRTLRPVLDAATPHPAGGLWNRLTAPDTRRGMLVAITITWARTVGEFGPLLLFVGILPGRTEVLSTAIYMSWQTGDINGAALAATLMVMLSFGVVLLVRTLGRR